MKKSPLAYIASLATVIEENMFSSFAGDPDALLHNSMLYWELRQCLNQVRSLLSIDDDIENTLLPSSPNEFFSFFAQHHNLISHLQHNLNSQATKLTHQASLRKAQDEDDTVTQARLTSITSPYASVWKDTTPSIPELRLADPYYRIASRMNLGLPAFVHLPDKCYSCGKDGACARDPYHYLSCTTHKRREITLRHNAVVHAICTYTQLAGGFACKEPHDMSDEDGRRPDIQIVLPNQHYLVDVVISHPLCPTHVRSAAKKPLAAAYQAEIRKDNKYHRTAQVQHAEFVPFALETMGGMAPKAVKLLHHILTSCRDEMTLWPHDQLMAELRGSIAVAVQRGNAMCMLSGYSRAVGRCGAAGAA
jgi:hypothetical protein